MKTNTHFFKLKSPLRLWNGLSDLLKAQMFSSELWQLEHCFPWVSSTMSMLTRKLVAAVKVAHNGLSALKSSATTNKRIFIGLGLVGIVSPLSACLYILFDQNGFVENWYHVNNFYLFMLLGPYLAGLFLTLGVFFLFPRESKRAYVLLLPMAYLIGKTIWLYQTNSNTEYWSVPHWTFFAMGLGIATVILISMDWLTWRFFHRELAFEKRLETIYNGREVLSTEQVGSMFLITMQEKKNFQKQY